MKILRIFDVSSYIHAGKVNKHSYLLPSILSTADGFRERKIYTGGVSMLWNVLYKEYGKCDVVFCMDKQPTKKQEMNVDYKATREFNKEVYKQKEVAKYILEDCGFTVLYDDGYEADDFIYSIVQTYKKSYDHIYVYTGDSDMYFLVDENVSIEPSNTRAKQVNIQNYTYTVRTNAYTPYNALTLYKIVYGDKSDNIAPFDKSLGNFILKVFEQDVFKNHMADKGLVIEVLSSIDPVAARQAMLVFPLDVAVPDLFQPGDKLRIAEWGDAIRNKLWFTGRRPSAEIEGKIEELADLGLSTD